MKQGSDKENGIFDILALIFKYSVKQKDIICHYYINREGGKTKSDKENER
jgi:hypothetical protein